MKKVYYLTGITLCCLMGVYSSFGQTQSPYKLPDAFKFDFQVTQVITENRKSAEPDTAQFFYTQSGEYAAVSVSGRDGRKGNLLMVLTRDGIGVFFNGHNKNITIVSVRKLVSDLSGFMKWIRIDSIMFELKPKM